VVRRRIISQPDSEWDNTGKPYGTSRKARHGAGDIGSREIDDQLRLIYEKGDR